MVMDFQNKLKRLKYFIEENESAILVNFLKLDFFKNCVIVDANIKKEDLYGNDTEPEWSVALRELSNDQKILIIKDITKCPIDDQKKFISIIKDKEYNDYDILKDTVIVVLDENYQRDLIDKELLSYLIIV